MRRILLPFMLGLYPFTQAFELTYILGHPKNWQVWMLTSTDIEAASNYKYANDKQFKSLLEERSKKLSYVKYQEGSLATFIEEASSGACHIKIINDQGKELDGWVHCDLLEMSAESKADLARQEQKQQIANRAKVLATKKLTEEKRRADEETKRRELAFINSLPKLVSSGGNTVFVATSLDCANDLRKIVDYGRRSGTGVEFRKKMVELMTLGCAESIDNGTPILKATRSGQFITFTAYKSGKTGVALPENVTWP